MRLVKFLVRTAFRLLLFLMVLAVAAILLKDVIAKYVLEAALQKKIGLEVRIGQVDVGLTTPTLTCENVVIYNSSDFGGAIFLDVPEFHVEYDLQDMRRHDTHFRLMRLNIRELNIVENQKGNTNIMEVLNKVVPGGFTLSSGKGTGKIEHFKGIDTLNLTVGKVKYTSSLHPRHNQETDVAIHNNLIPDIRTKQDISAVALKIFLRAGITFFYDSPARASTNRSRHATITKQISQ